MIEEIKKKVSQMMLYNKDSALAPSISSVYTFLDALEEQLKLADTIGSVVKEIDHHFEDEEIGEVWVKFCKTGREEKSNKALLEVKDYA